MAAVVGVRLPSLALPFPLASEDPNKGLRGEKNNRELLSVTQKAANLVQAAHYLLKLSAVAGVDDGV